jgi:hypothetical protein
VENILKNTKDRPEFARLYYAAAALMFSVDIETGLAVLMSYDYLAWFYSAYEAFLKNKEEWKADTDEFYQKLIKRIETK